MKSLPNSLSTYRKDKIIKISKMTEKICKRLIKLFIILKISKGSHKFILFKNKPIDITNNKFLRVIIMMKMI